MIRTSQTQISAVSSRATISRSLVLGLSLGLAAWSLHAPRLVHADVVHSGGAVTVTPGGRAVQSGLRTAVISATDTSGNVETAQSAMLAANVALARVPGYVAVPSKDVAAAFGKITLRAQPDAKDYQEIGKKTKAQRVLSLTVSPGDINDSSAGYSALAELYDTTTGGLVGRGQGVFTATAEAVNADTTAQNQTATADMATVLPTRALSGAVFQAINELTRPATFGGVVISIPAPYQARLSIGDRAGLRNGARVEYWANGAPVAYGTVIDVGVGEAVATIAPESAVSLIHVNSQVRTVSNPTLDRAGKSAAQADEAEFKRFERSFAISAAIVGIAYYAVIRD
ncbi:MAG TPA: hypothetical protein VF719_10460 [Abditibacteriaceae bacterium]